MRFEKAMVREAVILVLSAVLLTVAHYHGGYAWLPPRYQIYGLCGFNVVLFLVVPALVTRLAFREPLSQYGFGLGRPRVWGKDLLLLSLVLLPMCYLASRLPGVQAAYPRYRPALAEPWLLVPSTLAFGAYGFAWEFFFRGFLLFGLKRRFGPTAIFIQLVPFVMAHYQKGEAESFASILGGVIFGVLAWRGESFLGAWLLHWMVATSINLFVMFGPR